MTYPKGKPLVEVRWVDSSSRSGWETEKEWSERLNDKGLECYSVGYLLRKDRTRVTLVQSAAESGQYADAIDIPRQSVRSIRMIDNQPSWAKQKGKK